MLPVRAHAAHGEFKAVMVIVTSFCLCMHTPQVCRRACMLQGEFKAVMVIVTPCRSDMSAGGLCRGAHLADGRCHLALVRACTVWQHLRFLSLIPHMGAGPTPSAARLGLPSSGSQPRCYNHDGGQSHVLSLAGTTRVPLSRNTCVQAARAR
jgi:hypothetical protein